MCSKKVYSPSFLCKTISQIKYLVKATPSGCHSDQMSNILGNLNKFLFDPAMSVRLETVRTLTYIFNQNWIVLPSQFYEQLFGNIQFDYTDDPVSFIY